MLSFRIVAAGTSCLLLGLSSACQVPQVPAIGVPSPASPTAASLSDKAISPLASTMVMAAQAMGQMAGSGGQALGAVSMIPFRAAMTTQQSSPTPAPSATPSPMLLPPGIPADIASMFPGLASGSGIPVAIPSGVTGGFGLPFPTAVPSSMPWKQFWDWRDGWYWSTFNVGDRQLKFRFEDSAGNPADFDVMDMSLYGPPPKRTGFPQSLVRFHTEFANSYPLGVTVTSTLYGAIPPSPPTAQTRIPQQGHGTVRQVPVIGTIAFTVEADANGAGNDVRGKLVHTVTYQGATYTGESAMNLNGMVPPGTIKRDGTPIAEVRQGSTAGQWEIVADGKTVPVDASAMGPAL